MSLILTVKINFNEKECNTFFEQEISDICFKIIEDACKKKLAVERIIFRESVPYDWIIEHELQKNEMLLIISNSYIFREVEPILMDEFSVSKPNHLKRLSIFQDFIHKIYDFPIVDRIEVSMYDDGNYTFEIVNCSLINFANVMRNKLYQKLSFSYKFNFQK
ncbi:MAG: hypothetical protein J1F36_01585 [Clostridiales bacterium]|nr:hypothetical protein [Clostridiales bacterium]